MKQLKLFIILATIACINIGLHKQSHAEVVFNGLPADLTVDKDQCKGSFKITALSYPTGSDKERLLARFTTSLKKQNKLTGARVFFRKDAISSEDATKNFQGAIKGQIESSFNFEVDATENKIGGSFEFHSGLKSTKKYILRDSTASFYGVGANIKYTNKKVVIRSKFTILDDSEAEFMFGAKKTLEDNSEKELFGSIDQRHGDFLHISKIIVQTSVTCPSVKNLVAE